MTKVIAFGTDRQAYYDLFIESCTRYNIEPVILGQNEKWIGYGNKLIAIRNYLKDLPSKEIVIVVDSFDVVFLCGLDEIEYKFTKTSSYFLCGALNLGKFTGKIYNNEFNKTGMKLPQTPTNYSYLNTGTWISCAGYAHYLIGELADKFHMNDTSLDQQILTGLYIKKLYNVDIDWNCEIFHNLLFKDFITHRADLKHLKFSDTRVKNTATGTLPCIIHASGNTSMKEIAQRLGYEKSLVEGKNNRKNITKKAFFHIGQLLKSPSQTDR